MKTSTCSHFYLTLVVILAAALPANADDTGFTLAGTVLTPDGAPAGKADIWLCQGLDAYHSQADPSGRFAFKNVTEGRVDLVAAMEGFSIGGVGGTVIGPDDLTVQLHPPQSKNLRLLDRGKPIEGARLKSLSVGLAHPRMTFHVPVSLLADAGFPSTRSDETGLLQLNNLPDGGYLRLVLRHRKYAEEIIPYLNVDGEEQAIPLKPGVRLSGRVTAPEGGGVKRALVAAYRMSTQGPRRFGDAVTDVEGFYSMTVVPGQYFVSVLHADFASPFPTAGELRAGQESETFDVALRPACFVDGRVVDPEDEGMAGVPVTYWIDGFALVNVISRADGRFTLQIPPGEGVIRVSPPAGYMHANWVELTDVSVPDTETTPGADTEEEEATVPKADIAETWDWSLLPSDIPTVIDAGARVTLPDTPLKPLPTIAGTVEDDEGEPVANTYIQVLNMNPPLSGLSDESGAFRLQLSEVRDVDRVRLRLEHPHRMLRDEVAVNLNRIKPVKAKLKPFQPDVSPNDPERVQNKLKKLVNEPAPPILCSEWINSGDLTSADLSGKVLVLTLWGGFAESDQMFDRMEELVLLHDMFADQDDVAFVGVHDGLSEPDEIAEYIEEFAVTFPVGRDMDPFQTFNAYKTDVIPQTVLIDKRGVVRYYDVEGRLLELIKSLRREG
jgi:hypothetical protein